jgi:hypothetical protein
LLKILGELDGVKKDTSELEEVLMSLLLKARVKVPFLILFTKTDFFKVMRIYIDIFE